MVLDADGQTVALRLCDEGQTVLIGVFGQRSENSVTIMRLAQGRHLNGAGHLIVVYGVPVPNRLIHAAKGQLLCEGIELTIAHDGFACLVVRLRCLVSKLDELIGGVHGYILSLLLKVYHNC